VIFVDHFKELQSIRTLNPSRIEIKKNKISQDMKRTSFGVIGGVKYLACIEQEI
jgi:hypothetical protein